MVVSIELVNVFKLLVDVSILVNLPFCVSLIELNDEDKLPILELSPDVVIATDELKEPTDELIPDVVVATLELNVFVVVATDELKFCIDDAKPLVVVATDELKEPILELSPEVVKSTLELNVPILVDMLELNVEYPVVPVMLTCNDPETTLSPLSLFLMVVSIELVNVFKEPVEVSKLETLPSFDEVYELKLVSSNLPVPIG